MGFLNETYWLPRDVQWSQLPTDARDLLYPVYFTIPMLFCRVLLETLVGIPFGNLLGYGEGTIVSQMTIHFFGGFTSQTRSKRILECFWRFFFYTSAFIYGCKIMVHKSWLWDVKDCWIGYPWHKTDDDVWWYYMVELTFYYSLLISSIFDVRRSDFWQLIFHHIVTIGLLSMSYAINFVRVGTLVLFSHDAADILLEGGKLVKYDKSRTKTTNGIFVVFLLCWIVTRLGYYPFIVMRSAVFEAANLIQPDYDVFNVFQVPYAPRIIIFMLCCLVVLHVFWTIIIGRIVYKTAMDGEVEDIRSESEEDEMEERRRVERKKLLKKKRPTKQD
ncbi:hypothetical protein PMAYCL1PPCAC_17980 [Pristionchus mayeri]|uniref:TLC domain-containing protein n=1 Tax=Pristionchus mayeri TaxID=1317129 RepID=A0AAN5CP04_9BILA|nr:hypothetical protein PMAYCL1PPCAC_17980 [Pristionchus mayeri]